MANVPAAKKHRRAVSAFIALTLSRMAVAREGSSILERPFP
eukprot:CAMPEP_0170201794 /NCGR_PEP_ID=MMETSP0116_2-20130129/362_1 /TAXON_ID=400756 /ORGANISM="Durinskia baltica, Strain CSIRO CS-38" /LENGTH=40 /DNA_ID= /DNA_START= /DNA_END= /DNA_ORIENTATION=